MAPSAIIEDIIKKIAGFLKLEVRVEVKEDSLEQDGKALLAALYTTDNARFLIGKNGQSLKALEHLVRVLYAKASQEPALITLDVNDYRKSKAQYALEMARVALSRVRNTQKAEALAPMSAYERRVVHMELASCPDVTTESIGEEPQRRIVIKPFP